MAKQLLTQDLIDNFVSPDGKKQELRDTMDLGLVYEIGPTATAGNGTYQSRCRIDGKQRCIKICRGSEKPLLEVRRIFKKMKADVANGVDPIVEKKATQKILTLDQVFFDHYVPFKTGRKDVDKDIRLWNHRIGQRLGKKPIDKVTRKEIAEFHGDLLASGLSPSHANAHLRLLKHLYNCLINWDMFDRRNPAMGIPLYKEKKNERFLSQAEIEKLMVILQSHPNRPICLLAKMLLATGMRLQECLSLTWDCIDLNNGTLRIKAENTKTKRPHVLNLTPLIQEVLDELETKGRYDHLFVSQKTRKPLTWTHKSWSRMMAAAGPEFADVTAHVLRHTHASLLINQGHSLEVVRVLLNHTDGSEVTRQYAHLTNTTLKAASESVSDLITGKTRKAS